MSTTIAPGNLVREGTLNALRALTSRGTSWPEPTLSVGRKIGKFGGKELCWEAVGPARESFAKVSPRIKEHLDNGVETVPSWVTWSMYMIGKSPELACPTILFCSKDSTPRKLVRDVIKESGILDKYPGIKTGHTSRPPDFNQLVQMAEVDVGLGLDLVIKGLVIKGLVAPDNNACGMELVIYTESQDFFQSRAATVGGVVQLGECFYYFTAEHAFHVANDQDPYGESCYSDTDSDFSIDQDIMSHVSDDGLEPNCAAISKVDLRDDNDSLQENEPFTIAPTLVEITRQKQTIMRETVRLASVGISSRAGLATNLDYNLIKVSEASHQVPNSINHGGKTVTIGDIVVDGPKDVRILAITSRGILSGRLSGTSMYTSLPTASTYQEVYCVVLDCPLEIGDCGSWIIHAGTGDLFGHIVAGSPETGAAMVIPAAFIFNDLEHRTQLRPKLPMATIHLSPGYKEHEQPQRNEKEYSSRLGQQAWYEMDWNVDAAQFPDLMRPKDEKNVRNKSNTSTITTQGQSMAESLPTSYDQIIKNTEFRELFELFKERSRRIPEPPTEGDQDAQKFRNLLMSLSYIPLSYENHELLELARATMPLEEIYAKAAQKASTYETNLQGSTGKGQPQWNLMDHSVIVMMSWFKNDYFTWVNDPPCSECQSATVAEGMTTPTAEESALGALRVELYKCSNLNCLGSERFPRYRDAKILMQTKRGRAGEWVNCFGLFCRALGARVRWVWTAADDVLFIEVYSDSQRRWVHADPCKNDFDKPWFYSEGKSVPFPARLGVTNVRAVGRGKALEYAIAFSVDGATDVSRRYIRAAHLLGERPRTRCSEEVLVYILRQITAMRRTSLRDEEVARLNMEDAREELELDQHLQADLPYAREA